MKEKLQAKKDLLRLFNRKITIEKPLVIVDEIGQEIKTYEKHVDMWASVSNLYGNEYFSAKQVNAEKTVKFTVWFTKDITEDMRVVMENKTYNIIMIDNIKYHNELMEIKAIENDLSVG